MGKDPNEGLFGENRLNGPRQAPLPSQQPDLSRFALKLGIHIPPTSIHVSLIAYTAMLLEK
jgi:hypothetical protein